MLQPVLVDASHPSTVCWLYRPPRSFHALDLAVSQDRLDERYKDALSMLPDDIFSTVCKVPTIKAASKNLKTGFN